MTKTTIATGLLAIALASATPATAQQAGGGAAQQLRTACQADMKKLCDGIQPGGGRLLQCLRAKQGEASEPCQTALKKVPTK